MSKLLPNVFFLEIIQYCRALAVIDSLGKPVTDLAKESYMFRVKIYFYVITPEAWPSPLLHLWE